MTDRLGGQCIMKKFILVFLWVIGGMCTVFSQGITKNEAVAMRDKTAKPRTALVEADENLKSAIQEENNPLIAKYLLEYVHYQLLISQDSFPSLIRFAEHLRESSTDSVQRAVLSSIEAQMIFDYYEDTRGGLENGVLTDVAPDLAKIDEWDRAAFVRKISDLLQSSVKPAEILHKTSTQIYKEALDTDKDWEILTPTMLDFLAYRAIDIYEGLLSNPVLPLILEEPLLKELNMPAADFVNYPYFPEKYQLRYQVIAVYQLLLRFSDPGSPSYLIADLKRLKFLQDNNSGVEYPQKLENLLNVYKDSPYSVEIAIDLLDYYSRIWNTSPETKAYLVKLSDRLISRFPEYPRLDCLKSERDQLTAYSFNLNMGQVLYPGETHTLSFEYKNIKQLYLTLYRTEGNDSILQFADTLHLSDTLSLADRTGKCVLPALNNGEYFLRFFSEEKADLGKIGFYVSRIYAATLAPTEKETLVILTDSKSGKPLSGIPVKLFRSDSEDSYVNTVKADRLGLVRLGEKDTVMYFKPEMKNDVYYPLQNLRYGYWSGDADTEREMISLFTDRSVYRPGQTLYFSGIDYRVGEKVGTVVPDGRYTVVLSAQGKDIARCTVQGDSFGSFTGSFVFPSDMVNGYCRIRVEGRNESLSVQVSEYKRPTFRILFEPVKDAVSLGQVVSVNGKVISFSGVPVSGADVSYTVQRLANSWWRNKGEQIAQGELFTGEDGEFTLRFVARKSDKDALKTGTFYRFRIDVNVTSANGETQSQSYWVTVGESPLSVQMEVPEMIDKNAPNPVKFRITNMAGMPVSVKCKYILYSMYGLENPISKHDIISADSLKVRMQVEEKSFVSDNIPALESWKKLPSGIYRLVLQVTDTNGNLVIRNADFALYSMQDKKPPIKTYEWIPEDLYQVSDGESVDVIYGTSIKQAYVLYNLYDGFRLVDSRRVKISDKNYRFPVLYKPEYGDRLKLFVSFIKEGCSYNSVINIHRKKPDMKLSITTSTFRDRTVPGSQESWSFTVKDASGKPVSARFMTEMFDASLNEIMPHDWSFRPVYNPIDYGLFLRDIGGRNIWKSEQISTSCFPLYFGRFVYSTIYRRMTSLTFATQMNTMAKSRPYMSVEDVAAPAVPEDAAGSGNLEQTPVQYRRNFNETAFFYPQLTTNEQGEVSVKFTIPESNTEWQFQALAYTKDMKYGSYKNNVISQKQLMVAPNIPRFVRRGDEVSIATLMQNISDRLMSGGFTFELFDPYTDKVLEQKKQEFILEAGKSKLESVDFTVPEGLDVLGIRVNAVTPGVSDGEQHIIPILPSRTLVTEAEPFVLKGGKEIKNIRMQGLSDDAEENYRMVLEYTANPLWYVVQALPQLNEVSGTDVINITAALYGNTVASVLARNNPEIVSALQTWKVKNETGSSLASPLEKNEELKSVLISETPWALDAQNETERLQSLSGLLDVARAEQLQNKALELLRDLQKPEGGWGWMKKMPVSFLMTVNTLEGLSRLTKLGGIQYDEASKYMQMRAINYLDSCIILDQERRKANKSGVVSKYGKLLYVYVRSSYRDMPLAKALSAHKEIIEYIKREWVSFSLYEKAVAAVSLYRYGFTAEAKEILESLREYSTTTEELGMFWQNNKSSYAYRNSAIQVHTAIMNAFAEIDPNSKSELNEMKRWLIMQKQTQNWGSVPSTIDAVNAILNTGDYMLSASRNTVRITWGKTVLKPEITDGFTGYERYIRQGAEITPDLANVEVSADQKQPSWGALYRQYFADFTQIRNKAVKGFSIDKQFFVEQMSGKEKVYEPLNKVTLKSGDKVNIRLIIRTDRDLEFVHVKDQRPACFEPVDQLSRYECKDGVCYYQETKDAVTNLYFDFLPKGTYVISYDVWADRPGSYHNGISTIQCLYAPQWVANTKGRMIIVK